MTTINTMQDLTRLLRENPEWRDEIRRELLTEELLELPQRFAEYTKVADKRLNAIENKLDSLVGDVGLLRGRVDSLRGYALEQRLATQLPPLASREFDVRRVYSIWAPGIQPQNDRIQEFQDRLEQAVEEGVITDDDETRLRVTDLIMRSQRKTDRSTLWFAVEASGIINYEDITRARRSANALAKIYGQDAVPIVYGYHIQDEQKELARQLEVTVFLDPDAE
ncbi:MAG: hypothetical protein F4X34_06775 [Chloroflexi bacterium]|nr:hypothetical protein [Chloroflexota bacterium]